MDRQQAKAAWAATLNKAMPLTPLDFTAPQNYIMHVIGYRFSTQPGTLDWEREAAVRYLKYRLDSAFASLRFLGGQIIHARNDDELPRLVYSDDIYNINLRRFPGEVFDHQVLDSLQFRWSFDQLTQLGVPAHTMTRELFWLLPKTGPASGDACHPVTLRVSFIEGGVILGFALHHGVMDGGGKAKFFEYLSGISNTKLERYDILAKRKEQFNAFAKSVALTTPVDPRLNMPGYDFATPSTPPVIPKAIAKVFTISASKAAALYTAALNHIRSIHGPDAFISRTNTICGLVWLHITRVRLHAGRIRCDDKTSFATAVDVRNKPAIQKALALNNNPDEKNAPYVGNMFLRALATTTADNLVPETFLPQPQPATVAEIAHAAWLIRSAVYELNDEAVLKRHLAIATLATNPHLQPPGRERLTWPAVDAAIRRAIARHHTGVDASVGVALGADVRLDIPGVPPGGDMKPAWTRRAYVPFEGFVNLLPRKGVTKGEAHWEIWIAMREEDMRMLEGKGELGGWCVGHLLKYQGGDKAARL